MKTKTLSPLQATGSSSRFSLRKFSRWYFWGTLFVLPELIIFLVFLWKPIVEGILYSFYQIDFMNGDKFIGLQNYREVLHMSELPIAVKNTLYYMLLCLLIGFWVPALVAIAISELKWFKGLARIIGYLPSVIPAIVLYGMWVWYYDPIGPINSALNSVGVESVDFFSKAMSMVSIVIMETWQSFGGATLIYIAAISGISKDLYEAAEIDGASVLQRVRYITLPSMKGLLVLMLLLQLIATSQAFQAQLSMTAGGPDNATLTYMLLINREAFTNMNFGHATALGSLMFAVLLVISIVVNRLQQRSEA